LLLTFGEIEAQLNSMATTSSDTQNNNLGLPQPSTVDSQVADDSLSINSKVEVPSITGKKGRFKIKNVRLLFSILFLFLFIGMLIIFFSCIISNSLNAILGQQRKPNERS
jgi:hypothetical protein